jgi:2-succinyl-6-hydroxy-2,4-cyclohexadiene-1-carboxylate synthase
VRQAAAPPLVLLHGFTGGPESWRSVLDNLSPSWRERTIVSPYLAGHGEHPEQLGVDPVTHSFDAEVERLAAVCHTHGIAAHNAGVLVGYSLGARLGLGLLVRHPELFQRAVLVSVNPGLPNTEARWARRQHDEGLAQLCEREGLQALLTHWEQIPLFHTQKRLPVAALQEQATLRRRNTASGLALSLRTCGLAQMPDYSPYLPTLTQPIRLVVGQNDERFLHLAERMCQLLPRATVALVPGCGHNVPLEAPATLSTLIQSNL